MDDFDPVLLLVLAVAAVVLLKPDLLAGLLGGRAATPAAPPGPGVMLYPPPPASPAGAAAAWRAAGRGDGSGKDAANPLMPVGWKPGDPTWKKIDDSAAKTAAYNAEHPCPGGLMWNTLTSQCLVPGKWTTVAPPSTQTPTVPPRAESSAPAAVAEIKASQRRAALFTPWS